MTSRQRIVVIDDTAMMRVIAELELRHCQVDCLIPGTPEEIDAIVDPNIDILLLDRHMPPSWEEAVDRLLARLPDTVKFWEWTVAISEDNRRDIEFDRHIDKMCVGGIRAAYLGLSQ